MHREGRASQSDRNTSPRPGAVIINEDKLTRNLQFVVLSTSVFDIAALYSFRFLSLLYRMLYAARAHTHVSVCVVRVCLRWYSFVSIAWALHPWKKTHAQLNTLLATRSKPCGSCIIHFNFVYNMFYMCTTCFLRKFCVSDRAGEIHPHLFFLYL